MPDAVMMIIARVAQTAAEEFTDFEDRAKAAFRSAKGTWITLDENTQFKGGIAAILIMYADDVDMTERLTRELQSLRTLEAMMSGVPVDVSGITESDIKPLGLMKLWHECKDAGESNA